MRFREGLRRIPPESNRKPHFRGGVFRQGLIALLALSTTISARPHQPVLLPDGHALRGVDGRVAYDPEAQGWFFESLTALPAGRKALPKGVKLQLLPSSAFDSLQIDLGQRSRSDYRLWAKATQYEGKNYLFVNHYLPLGPMEPPQPSGPRGESTQNSTPAPVGSVGIIPLAIQQRRAAKKRVERMSVAGAKVLKPNRLMLDRVGYLVEREGGLRFALDGLGLQVQDRRISLLPCRLLGRMHQEQRDSLTAIRFRIAGLITEYQGQDYLMIHRATQVHHYGNFGR